MKVKAITMGYYDNRRYRPGQVFIMADEIYHPPGKKNPCSWVEPFEGYEVDDNGKIVEKKKPKAKKEA